MLPPSSGKNDSSILMQPRHDFAWIHLQHPRQPENRINVQQVFTLQVVPERHLCRPAAGVRYFFLGEAQHLIVIIWS